MDSTTLLPFCVTCSLLFLLPPPTATQLSECERGVRRPHPTQENAYQIYVRSDLTPEWLDQSCPAPTVFSAPQCTCVTPDIDTPSPAPSRSAYKGRKTPWFSTSKSMKQQMKVQSTKKGQRKRPPPPPPPPSPHTTQNQGNSIWAGQPKDRAPVTGKQECLYHRKGPGYEGQYEQWTETGWVEMDCNWPVNAGLVWSQQHCRCDWGPNRVIAKPDLNGVSAMCLMMLKMTFDDGEIKDVGRGVWLDIQNRFNVEAIEDDTAVEGWAGAFRGSGISVPFFKMNTLGATFRIKFRFRLCDGMPDADLMLVNNGCMESDALPSLQVMYRAWTNTLYFQMATLSTQGPVREECSIEHQHPWVDINIHYDDDLLEIFANGRQCVRSVAYSGPIVQTDCPMSLLEDNFCGLLDEVVMTRGCTADQES
ncbi:uncharacterized protein [Littorina saxatilis]|uniref:Uncharacterized protein n=1 Tax=Littorina saxatilis TaxID=31220 RepID=A0AAN9BGH1_9CAEN